jgi:serine/threonine protein kinase
MGEVYRAHDPKLKRDVALKILPAHTASDPDRRARFEREAQSIAALNHPNIVTISTTGGAQVRWRRDGKELFYIALDGRLMAVPVEFPASSQTVEPGRPVALFETHIGGAVQGFNKQQYVVSSDGQRFLMNVSADQATTAPITVLVNWTAGLKK